MTNEILFRVNIKASQLYDAIMELNNTVSELKFKGGRRKAEDDHTIAMEKTVFMKQYQGSVRQIDVKGHPDGTNPLIRTMCESPPSLGYHSSRLPHPQAGAFS